MQAAMGSGRDQLARRRPGGGRAERRTGATPGVFAETWNRVEHETRVFLRPACVRASFCLHLSLPTFPYDLRACHATSRKGPTSSHCHAPSRHYHTNGDDQHRRLLINMLQSGTIPPSQYRHRRQQQISTGHADDSLWVNKFKNLQEKKTAS